MVLAVKGRHEGVTNFYHLLSGVCISLSIGPGRAWLSTPSPFQVTVLKL
jgi:hypothetical protein